MQPRRQEGGGGAVRACCLWEEAEKMVKGQRQGTLALCALPVKLYKIYSMLKTNNERYCPHVNVRNKCLESQELKT